jgi:hypothetical protein
MIGGWSKTPSVIGCWLMENRVIHDHDLDCLYLERDTRRRVFLGQAPRASVTQPRVEWERVRHGFFETHRADLHRLLDRHADVFDDSSPLRQTPFIKYDIVLADLKPFRPSEEGRQILILRQFPATKFHHRGFRVTPTRDSRGAKGLRRSHCLLHAGPAEWVLTNALDRPGQEIHRFRDSRRGAVRI